MDNRYVGKNGDFTAIKVKGTKDEIFQFIAKAVDNIAEIHHLTSMEKLATSFNLMSIYMETGSLPTGVVASACFKPFIGKFSDLEKKIKTGELTVNFDKPPTGEVKCQKTG